MEGEPRWHEKRYSLNIGWICLPLPMHHLRALHLQDDAAWKENLIGMGNGPGVPKLLHHNGKVRGHVLLYKQLVLCFDI